MKRLHQFRQMESIRHVTIVHTEYMKVTVGYGESSWASVTHNGENSAAYGGLDMDRRANATFDHDA